MTKTLASYIDHTALKADTTKDMIDTLCAEAKEHGFFSVCVNPVWVKYAADALAGSKVKVCTVIGFPLGANTPATKAFEAQDALANGAHEVDMVINIGAAKKGDWQTVEEDIKAVVEAVAGKALVKVIIETSLLTDDEKVRACVIARDAGADFVKTSTGFSTGGATIADIKLMRDSVGPDMGVKASGGVSTREDAEDLIKAGASRIGASKSVAIVTGQKAQEGGY
ncbi:TPA: deoxyribose-phosphate aldolase [Streptococcus suis]